MQDILEVVAQFEAKLVLKYGQKNLLNNWPVEYSNLTMVTLRGEISPLQ